MVTTHVEVDTQKSAYLHSREMLLAVLPVKYSIAYADIVCVTRFKVLILMKDKLTAYTVEFSGRLQVALNISLLVLSVILLAFLCRDLYELVLSFFNANTSYNSIEGILVYFLYFEFISLIIIYFKSKYHFPLHYFVYVAITAIIRAIILTHDNSVHTLIYTLAIFILVGILYICTSDRLKDE